jgi:hypothetical protein
MPVVHDVRRDAGRPSHVDVRGAMRRLDWRFLLPNDHDAPLGRLRLLGGDACTAQLIVDCGLADTVVTETDDGPVDAVVSLGSEPRDVQRLLSTLRPGGVIYCEVDRASRRMIGWSASRLNRRLRRAGFRTTVYWRRRRGDHDNLFLPLDAPGAVPWYLREVIDDRGLLRGLARAMLRLLVRGKGHRLGLLARRYSVVGVADPPRAGSAPRALPSPGLLGPGATDVVPALLAGGEGAWSRLVLLPFGPTDSQPREVLKLPRAREHNRATEREQQTLARLRPNLPSDLAAGVPSARGIRTWSGLCVGSESFVPGRPVGFLTRTPGARLEAAVDWLIRLDSATWKGLTDRPSPSTREIFDEAFRTTVERLRLPLNVEQLCRRFGVARVGERPVPVVWQHGDLTPFNLRWDGSRHSLVDWESARPGPALCDLLYLLLHWQWRDLPRFGVAPAEVLDAVFLCEGGHPADSASTQVRRYCAALGVDDVLVSPLLLRTLSEQALDRADRIRDIGLDPAQDQNLYADLFCHVANAGGRPGTGWAGP